jgi:hypothetical protein
LALPDGASAELRDGALELRDGEGRLLVRYVDGTAEILAPAGDLKLSAPQGRVRLSAALDVEVDAQRVRVRATSTELESGRLSVVARHVGCTAERLAHNVERYELVAERLVEKTRHSFRDVAELLQTRVGRVRTLVRSTYALWSKRTVMSSSEDTSIDGRKVLLG